MSRSILRKLTPVTASLATLALAGGLVACSSDSDTTDAADSADIPSVEKDDAIYEMLPQNIKDSGTIRVGTEAFYPPYEYLDEDGSTIIGLDPDLFEAMTQRMGVDFSIENIAFDSLLPSLDTDRFDAVAAAMTDNKERQANYDFIDYFSAGQSIVVPADNPEGISDFPDLCGKTVSVLKTSAQELFLEELNSEECSDNPIDILAQQTDNDALMQVQNGRAVGVVSQDPVAKYNAETVGDGQFIVANDEPAAPQPLGFVVAKGNDELAEAMRASLQSLLEDGTYQELLDAHNVGTGALDEITINAGE